MSSPAEAPPAEAPKAEAAEAEPPEAQASNEAKEAALAQTPKAGASDEAPKTGEKAAPGTRAGLSRRGKAPSITGRQDHKLDRRPRALSRGHVDVVLVEPQMPENIGTAARAIANTGLGRLVVVNPRTLSREIMEATATSHALPVLDKMLVAPDLLSALAPYQLVVGTTSRAGSRRGPLLTPAGLAPLALSGDPPPKTALLFGPERMGLSTADLRHCQKVVRIPTAKSAASSLNLAQAVLILGYELLLGAGGEPAAPPGVVPAPFSSVNRMYRELENLLVAIGYLPAGNPGHWLMNIKKILNRTLLTQGECDLLLGLCRQIRWAVKNLSDLPPGPEDPA